MNIIAVFGVFIMLLALILRCYGSKTLELGISELLFSKVSDYCITSLVFKILVQKLVCDDATSTKPLLLEYNNNSISIRNATSADSRKLGHKMRTFLIA